MYKIKKAKIELTTPLIALMFGTLIFTGLFTVFMSVADEYDVNNDMGAFNTQGNETTVESAFFKINETKTKIDEANQEMEDTALNPDTGLFSFFSLALTTGKTIYNSLDLFKDIFQVVLEITGVPEEIFIALFAILTTTFVILIIFILLGRST